MKKVVVTGIGLVTPVGNDVKTTWENLINGVSGINKISAFDVSSYDTQIAAEVKNFNLENIHPRKKKDGYICSVCN